MIIIGLTGSIGMGKTTVAGMFEKHGVPTIDSDTIVHGLYQNEAVPLVEEKFPDAVIDGQVDRKKLSEYVLGQERAFKDLEAIVHPLVRQKQDEFVNHHRQQGAKLILLDIPLLFETGAENRFDTVIVVSCSPEIQRQRVLARKNMTEEKFEAILAKQMPDAQKRAKAGHVVDTSTSLDQTEMQVIEIIGLLRHS